MLATGWPMDRMESFWSSIVTKLQGFQQAYHDDRTFVLYKTTTPDWSFTPMGPFHARELSHATEAGINVTDAYAVLQAFHNAGLAEAAYVDPMHFRPFVYEQLNDVLLNKLCP